MRNGPPYPRADNFGGYNMAPPHSVPNPHNHGPLPMGASARPPSKMFGPPDFPGISSADAYRQHHEVTAMVRSLTAWLYYVKKKTNTFPTLNVLQRLLTVQMKTFDKNMFSTCGLSLFE